jgi:hypothetical protein
MKKKIALAILAITLIGTSGTALAANNISKEAVSLGGQSVAQCAQMMKRGVSQCVNSSCNMQPQA